MKSIVTVKKSIQTFCYIPCKICTKMSWEFWCWRKFSGGDKLSEIRRALKCCNDQPTIFVFTTQSLRYKSSTFILTFFFTFLKSFSFFCHSSCCASSISQSCCLRGSSKPSGFSFILFEFQKCFKKKRKKSWEKKVFFFFNFGFFIIFWQDW